MPISTLPTPPSRADDPSNFSSKSDALLGALPTFVTEANAAVTVINAASANVDAAMAAGLANAAANATTATTQAGIATTQAGLATSNGAAQVSLAAAQVAIATTKANDATSAANAAADSAASIAGGPVASVNGSTGAVTLKTINGAAIVGSGDITAGASLIRSARTSNTILGVADKGTLIDITSGTFSQTFSAVATLGSGWYCYLKNSGVGIITLDPNSSEQIDGLTSFVMYPGEVRLIQCDGLALRSIVLNAFSTTFTGSDTFVKPPGYKAFEGLLWAGGGAGFAGASGYGGGGGACVPFTKQSSLVGATASVFIGAGGSTQASAGGTSTFDGISSFGGYSGASGSGGTGGGALSAGGDEAPGKPCVATTAAIDNPGFGGAYGAKAGPISPGWSFYGGGGGGGATGAAVVGGKSFYGGAGGGGAAGAGGSSVFGGAGGAGGSTVGTAGTAPGGGGGGGTTPGAGARGELRLWGIL